MSERTDADLIRQALDQPKNHAGPPLAAGESLREGCPACDALAALDRLVADRDWALERGQNLVDGIGMEREMRRAAEKERDRLAEAQRSALTWLTDALESTGESDDDLLEQPGTLWVRLICARDALADKTAGTRERA